MPLVKDEHMVETLTSNGAEHPFDRWVLPRGARCGKDLLHPETVDASVEVRSVGLVSIPSCTKTRPSRHRRKNCASRNQAKTLAREQVTRRPPTLDCGSTHRWIGCVSFIIVSSRHPGQQRGNRPAQRASGQAPSLSSAVIRPRVLRDRRGGHELYAVGRGCPNSSTG